MSTTLLTVLVESGRERDLVLTNSSCRKENEGVYLWWPWGCHRECLYLSWWRHGQEEKEGHYLSLVKREKSMRQWGALSHVLMREQPNSEWEAESIDNHGVVLESKRAPSMYSFFLACLFQWSLSDIIRICFPKSLSYTNKHYFLFSTWNEPKRTQQQTAWLMRPLSWSFKPWLLKKEMLIWEMWAIGDTSQRQGI